MAYQEHYDGIDFEIKGHVAYLTFNNPATLNALSYSIFKSIKEIPGFAAGTFDRDAAFRAVIGRQGRGDIEWSKP